MSPTDAEQLPGTWQATAITFSGQILPEEELGSIQLVLTMTRFTTRRGTETLFDSTYTIDTTKSPMQIQMLGSGGDFEGKPALGIYEFEAETLRLCYKMPGYPRPTDFSSAPGSGAFLILLKRMPV
jgi:uncharacterized protein (TIGR03067 family)